MSNFNDSKVIDWDFAIPIIEKALGFTLYDWQKRYLHADEYTALGRATGRTMAYCIKLALTYPNGPIKIGDIEKHRDEEHGYGYQKWFRSFFLDIWERLKDAGLPVVEIADKGGRILGQEPLLIIEVKDMESVPVVRYKGAVLTGMVKVGYEWETKGCDDLGKHSLSLEYFDQDQQSVKSIKFRRFGGDEN